MSLKKKFEIKIRASFFAPRCKNETLENDEHESCLITNKHNFAKLLTDLLNYNLKQYFKNIIYVENSLGTFNSETYSTVSEK